MDSKLVHHFDLHRYPEPVAWEGRAFQRWVRTSLAVAKWKTWRALQPLTLARPNADIFSGTGAFFAEKAPLSELYRDYLETWLLREPSPGSAFRDSWHSKEPLNAKSRRRLQEKARCILSEHTLSLRATEAGILLLDPKRLSLPGPKRLLARLRRPESGAGA